MFKIVEDEKSSFIFDGEKEISFVSWTTTPWTLPSNTTGVGKKITYVKVNTYNSYTLLTNYYYFGKDLLHKYFTEGILLSDYKQGDKQLPYQIIEEYKGVNYLE